MLEITGHVQRAAWDRRVLPPVERVRPGLWSIPVPIPQNPLRYVLVYALALDGGGVAIIDAGWDTDEAWTALTRGLAVAGFRPQDVRAVLVTHIHPDHYGLAGRVRDVSGAWIALHPADAANLAERYGDVEALLASMRELLRTSGVPQKDLDELTHASLGVKEFVHQARPDVLLDDGDHVDLPGWKLRAVWTPGHSPGHLCFYDPERKLLLSGDHVLPTITPNVSAHSQQRPNPLDDFLDALTKVRALDTDEVLPAHQYRFSGLATRTSELHAHHVERLRETESEVRTRPGSTTWEITLSLTWSQPWDSLPEHLRRAAVGETLAHLLYLEYQGRVGREPTVPERWHAPVRASVERPSKRHARTRSAVE